MITIIGDVHGKYYEYLELTKKYEHTAQVGDFGFHYGCMAGTDPARHKIIGGNHDNYDVIDDCPNYLGRFGNTSLTGIPFFFVSGAFSIDKAYRVEGQSWWRKEELTYEECGQCLELYYRTQPDIVISHDCPSVASSAMFNISDKTMTRQLMGQMWARWRPKTWVFGHWHESKIKIIGDTTFVCLAELETFNLQ